jgi:hypothetical protein
MPKLTLVDAMGTGDDAALCACRKTSVRRTTGTAPEGDDVSQDLAGPDRRKLVDVANDQEGGLVGHCLHECLHQHDIDYGGLIDNQQVTVQRVVVAAPKPPP